MRYPYLVAFWCCCFLSINHLLATPYSFRHYKDYLPVPFSSVYDLAQDHRGYIWVASRSGVFRFDGKEFVSINELTNRKIDSNVWKPGYRIIVDQQDRVWISLGDEILCYDQRGGSLEYPLKNTPAGGWFSDLCEDNMGNVWIASGTILNYVDTRGNVAQVDPCTAVSVAPAFDKHLWIGLANGNLVRYNPNSKVRETYELSFYKNKETNIRQVMQMNDSTLLLRTNNDGLFMYHFLTNSYVHLIPNVYIHSMLCRNSNEYWVATEAGIYIYHPLTGEMEHLLTNNSNPYSLLGNAVHCILQDRENGIWVGTWYQGISYMPNPNLKFDLFLAGRTDPDFYGNVVKDICPDRYGNLWIATEDDGLNKYSPQSRTFTNYSRNNPTRKIGTSNVYTVVAMDKELWFGSFNNGIEVMDIPSGKIVRHYRNIDRPNSLLSDYVRYLYVSHRGELWVGTNLGLQRYNKRDNSFDTMFPDTFHNTPIIHIYEDSRNRMWFSSIRGLFCMEGNGHIGFYHHSQDDRKSLSDDYVNSVKEDSRHRIWVATNSGINLFNESDRCFERIALSTRPDENTVYKVEEDSSFHFLWLSTSGGLVQFSPEDRKRLIYTTADGLYDARFHYASYQDMAGRIYMGTLNGMIAFRPDSMLFKNHQPKLSINRIGYSDGVHDTAFYLNGDVGSICLTNKENNLTFDCSVPVYATMNTVQYTYILDGFDTDWKETSKSSISYQNLPPGSYTFKVRSTNGSGVWLNNVQAFPFTINPPFYASIYAYLLYILALLGALWALARYYASKGKKRQLLFEKEMNARKEKELYDAKIQFFTTIAHEIRTPLTLIKLPLEWLKDQAGAQEESQNQLALIDKNTSQLVELCNQLLDFRKMETEQLHLNFVKTDIKDAFNTVLACFEGEIRQRGLACSVTCSEGNLVAAVDRAAFLKMCSNLIGNAVKYSDRVIRFELHDDGDKFVLSILNDGALLIKAEEDKIFSMFYRGKHVADKQGNGIGLPFTRQLAEMHLGRLEILFDVPNMNHFQLTLPITQAFTFEEIYFNGKHASDQEKEPYIGSDSKYTILIAEDQTDLLHYLASHFKCTYRVFTASNGKQALEILQREAVNLVISDVMMPGVNGFELCKTIKGTVNYSHIPVILMTAKGEPDSKIEGIEYGADDYIEKPFSLKYLSKRVDNIIQNRERLYASFLNQPLIPANAARTADQSFLNEFNALVEQHLDKTDLNIDFMAQQLACSTSTLYKRMKAITKLSPNEYIRMVRLKKAAELLLEGKHIVKEVAYQVGFSSPTYFATCFQRQFGVSPSEYAE